MSVAFSAKISMLRKEKDITQRQAAKDLGVSQALLSHYERGIRECHLDFVTRAAQYYGVSADYLLGLTENKHGLSNLYAPEPIETDDELIPKTVLRAVLDLSDRSARAGDAAVKLFCSYFSLAAKEYIFVSSTGTAELAPVFDTAKQNLLRELKSEKLPKLSFENADGALSTAQRQADALLNETIRQLTSSIIRE